MSTFTGTISGPGVLKGERGRTERGVLARNRAASLGFFLATPFIGLGYAAAYGAFGLAVAVCYGLRAFGVTCGLFKK